MSSSAEFTSAAVVAPHPSVAAAGQFALAQGANALEAAIAMAAASAVACPHRSGLGGDAAWLVRTGNGRVRALAACGRVGAGATIRRYHDLGLDRIPRRGPMAALTVPGAGAGLVSALELARALGGRLPLRDLLSEAIRLAREGAPVGAGETRGGALAIEPDAKAPGLAETFLVDGATPRAGALRRQQRLADTLDHLARAGPEDLCRGDVAREIAADLDRLGAPITRQDLLDNLRAVEARWSSSLTLTVEGVELWSPGPPAAGLPALALLGVLDRLKTGRADSFAHAHGVVEAAKRALALEERLGADPDWPRVDPAELLEPRALEREAAAILADRAGACAPTFGEAGGVFLAAMDSSGLAVACVLSLGPLWGSGCVLPATGVLMGAGGASLSLDEASPRALRPGLLPMSPFSPLIALFPDGKAAALGVAGGAAPTQGAAQILARLRAGAGALQAVEAPRFAAARQPGKAAALLRLEDGLDPSLARALERAGHETRMVDSGDVAFGEAGLIVRRRDGRVTAAHDPRGGGEAAGL